MEDCKFNINGTCTKLSDDTVIQPCIESPCPNDDEEIKNAITMIRLKQFIKDFEEINPFPETDLKYSPEVLRKLIYHNASCDPTIKELPFRDVFKALNEYIDKRFQRFIKSNL